MKKKIGILALSLMLIATGVSASSLNGEYNGNPIVKLKSNGNVIDTGEVPAMIYDGKTMVPISALRNLGATVTWDPNTYSVDVNIPKSTSSSDVRVVKDPNVLKNAKIANMYKLVQDLSNDMKEYPSTLSLYFQGHIDNLNNALPDTKVNDSIQLIIKQYNFVSDKYNAFIKEYPSDNFSDLFNVVQNNYDALENYKIATDNLLNWRYYRSINDNANAQTAFNNYLSKSNSGFSLALQAKATSNNGYDKYILQVINQ